MNIIHLVQDPGIRPGSKKGAAAHVDAMCRAFAGLGARVARVHGATAEEAAAGLDAALSDGADLVYERYALGAHEGARVARERGLAHVYEVNAPLEDEAQRWRGVARGEVDRDLERESLAAATLVLCVSRSVADYAIARGARPGSIVVRPNGVDASVFQPLDPSEADRLRARTFPELASPFVVGFHGRLRPWHGLARIVDATAELVGRGVEAALLCVGEGAFEPAIAGKLDPCRWQHIPWCRTEELARWVASFHVVPFGYEPDRDCYFSPLKLRESMATGAVPIVPRLGELPETVRHGEAGIVVTPGSVESMADAMELLARHPAERGRLGRAARSAVADDSWDSIARDVLARTSEVTS